MNSNHKYSSSVLSLLLLLNFLPGYAEPAANTLPSGYQVQGGNVSFDNSVSNILNVNSASVGSIVNYQSFSIGRDSIVNLNLPSSSSTILNRVVGSNVSEIFGKLNSNGYVFLVNPSGILFGTGSQVNVGSLFASTLPINDNDFLNGIYVFKNTGSPSFIINQGSLKGTESINLFAGGINNTGSIEAPVVNLAVGDKITASLGAGISVDVVVNDELKQKVNGFNDAISNSGSIKGTLVNLKTNLESGIYENAVNNSGLVKATGMLDILGQTQNTIQETQTITETVINDNGTPADPTDDFSEQVQKQVLVDKVVTSSDGTIKNSSNLEGGNLKIEAGVLENNPNAIIKSTVGNIDIQLSGSKTASVAPLDNTLVHNGSSPPTQRPSTETISYSLLNQGTIQSANDLNIQSPLAPEGGVQAGPIINRSEGSWDASLIAANDINLTAPDILNQRGGFYTSYHAETYWIGNAPHDFEYWTDREPGTNAFILSGNDLNIKSSNFINQAGSITVGNNLNFNTAPDAPRNGNFVNVSKILQETKHEHWVRKRFGGKDDRNLWWSYSVDSPPADLYVEYDANLGTLTNPINNFTNTGLIDVGNFTAYGSGNFVNGITDRNVQNPSNFIPGTIQTNNFRFNAENYDIPLGYFLNTGLIEGANQVVIKAQRIENIRRTALAQKNIKTYKGLFSPSRFEQVVYDSIQSGGEIRGGQIFLLANDEFLNKGGLIKADTLLSIEANRITNTVQEGSEVVTWDTGNLGKLLGMKNWGYKSIYEPGTLSSDGEINLIAKGSDGTLLNQGSDIIAKGDINIKADKLVEQNWVASHYTSSDKLDLKGLKIIRDKETAHVTRGSTIASTEGNINIEVGNETIDGTFRNTASDVLANKNIDISAKNIEISDATYQSWNRHTEAGLFKAELPGYTQFGYIDTKNTVTTQQSSNLVAGGNISLNTLTPNPSSSHSELVSEPSSISITGSNVIADGNVSLKAENISIKNGEYTDQLKQIGFTTQAGMGPSNPRGGGLTTIWQTKGSQETFTPSNIISGKTLSIDSKNTDIKSSNLAADEKIAIKADNLSISGDWERGESNTNFASLGAEIGFAKAKGVAGAKPGVTITATGGNSNSENGNFIASSLNAPVIERSEGSITGTFINGQGIGMPEKTTYSNSESTAISGSVTIGPGYFIPGASYTHLENGKGFSIGGTSQGPSGAFIDGAWSFGGSLSKPTDSLSTSFSPFVYNSDLGLGFSTTLGQTKGESNHWYVSPNLLTPIGPVGGTFQEGQLVGFTVGPYSELINNFNYTCFVAGTRIKAPSPSPATGEGSLVDIPIEEIKVGDKVLSWNEKTNEVGVKEVEKTFIRQAKKILKLTLSNGSILETTPDHPFWSTSPASLTGGAKQSSPHTEPVSGASGKWVNAGDLKLGDKLLNVNLEEVFVQAIEEEAGTTVYNFEVKDNHTYFAENILVHNADKKYNPIVAQEFNNEMFEIEEQKYIPMNDGQSTILTGEVTIGVKKATWIELPQTDKYLKSLSNLIQITQRNGNLSGAQKSSTIKQLKKLRRQIQTADNIQTIVDAQNKVSKIGRQIQSVQLDRAINTKFIANEVIKNSKEAEKVPIVNGASDVKSLNETNKKIIVLNKSITKNNGVEESIDRLSKIIQTTPNLNYLQKLLFLGKLTDLKLFPLFNPLSNLDNREKLLDKAVTVEKEIIETQRKNILKASETIAANILKSVNDLGVFTSTSPPSPIQTNNGRQACAWAVNKVLNNAGIATLGGNGYLAVMSVETDLMNGRGLELSQSEAKAGDITIVNNWKLKQHIGICLDDGCTQVRSNSSSKAEFSWDGPAGFDYRGSPYHGLTPRFYRVVKEK